MPPGLVARLAGAERYVLRELAPSEKALLAAKGRVQHIGVHRAIGEEPFSRGKWETLPNGAATWRLAIRSPGAAAIRVRFSGFSAGSGKVWVYGANGGANGGDDGQSQGPYSGLGIFGNGEFWSGTVWGDTATIEYQPADGIRSLPFEIRNISHRVAARTQSPLLALPGPAVDPAGSCNLDVTCYPEWSDAMKMVAETIFETEDNGQQVEAACSATLVATRDNSLKPYLLTAGHCINNEPDARTLETFWTYQTSQCDGPAPLLKNSTTSKVGASYLASGDMGSGDYSLLLLKDVPGGVLYSGWDTVEMPMGSNLVGVHHPMASYKRILFGHRTADELADVEGNILPANLYYVLTLDDGIAQPGSSGSALFSAPGVIVGTLTYGPIADGDTLCAVKSFDIGYGRFSVAYPNLQAWLEDMPYSEVLPSVAGLPLVGTDGVISGGPRRTVMLTTQAAQPVTFSVRSDASWIQVSTPTMTTSASQAAPLTIAVNPKMLAQTGRYTGTVTILSGAAPPQFVNVQVDMKFTVSNVTVSANPNPVQQGDDGLWSYTVELRESAGVSTHVNLLRIDGRDYSGQIANWFGSDRLAASGTLDAPLKSQVLSVPATQTIEVGGIDDSSQKNWYRVMTVSLVPGQ